MKFCRVLIGPITNEHGPHWPPDIVELNDNDAAVLSQFKFVEVLAVQPVATPEISAEPVPDIALLVDLNTATLEELQALPHVGPVVAQKLIEGLPYTSLDEARIASGLTMTKWTEIEALVAI